jgi:hypothetical protein
MPFQSKMRPYTKENIEEFDPKPTGVYGIFLDKTVVFIGSGRIREHLLKHIMGDDICITTGFPTLWTAEIIQGDPRDREAELLKEYQPFCNESLPYGERF